MGARILIIEDNPANLELMTYLLTASAHTVLPAEEGYEGLDTTQREHPDLIICDVQLPDIDGLEVVRRLKRDQDLSSIPVVAVTAMAMVGDRDRVIAAGFDGYMVTPIDPETFVHQFNGFLPNRQQTAPPALSSESSAPAQEQIPRGATILVVDNLQVNLDLAKSILGPSGYRVLTAGNMGDGLTLAREHSCDLILSDVCMPQGSGYEFLEQVQADTRIGAIPFILITSTMMTEKDRAKGLALGATRYLRRPIEPEPLLAEIRACLGKK